MRKGLTQEWSIDLDGEYASRIVDQSLQFVGGGRTIWISVWNPPVEDSPQKTLEGVKGNVVNQNPDGKVAEQSADGLELRYASWYAEPGKRGPQYSLYGYTVRRGSLVQSVFISDSPNDTDWALARWRSLLYEPPPSVN
jgi:hypothetical protein